MVSCRAAWLLSLLLLGVAHAEVELKLASNELKMGKSLRVEIIHRGDFDPGEPDLSRWQDRVFVEGRYSELSEDEPGTIVRQTSVRIYPRQTGELILPRLAYGDGFTELQRVKVRGLAGKGSLKAPTVIAKGVDGLRVGQPALIRVSMTLGRSGLKPKLDELSVPGLDAEVLPLQRDGNGAFVTGWVVQPTRPGRYTVDLPAIRYQRAGGTRYRFHVPALDIHVSAIPSYVPPTVPVGEPVVAVVQEQSHSAHGRVSVTLPGRGPEQLVELEDALLELTGLTSLESKRTVTLHDGGWSTRYVYLVTLPRTFWPRSHPHALQLRYYDPVTGRISSKDIALDWGGWPSNGALVLMGAVLMLAVVILGAILRKKFLRAWTRWRIAQVLGSSQSAEIMRRRVLELTARPTLGEAMQRCEAGPELVQAMSTLNRRCFARS